MSRWLTTRRSQWLPGVAILVVAACATALVGGAIGTRSWTIYLGLLLAVLLGLGWLERLRLARPAPPPPPRARGKLKIVQGGKSAFDLERDKSTDDQKYVM